MKDKLGNELSIGDLVLTPENGPYMNWARVVGHIRHPREGVELNVAYQPENDPQKPWLAKLQTVNSPNRLIKVTEQGLPHPVRLVLSASRADLLDYFYPKPNEEKWKCSTPSWWRVPPDYVAAPISITLS